MNKTEAIEKIKKILALATDRAATSEEKDTALKMTNKLADKHGLKIVNPTAPQATSPKYTAPKPATHFYEYIAKRPYTELLEAFGYLISKAGFPCYKIMDGKKVIGIKYLATRDLAVEFENLYKRTIKSCEKFKKAVPANSYMSGRAKTSAWKMSFIDVYVDSSDSRCTASVDGLVILGLLKKLKEELG